MSTPEPMERQEYHERLVRRWKTHEIVDGGPFGTFCACGKVPKATPGSPINQDDYFAVRFHCDGCGTESVIELMPNRENDGICQLYWRTVKYRGPWKEALKRKKIP